MAPRKSKTQVKRNSIKIKSKTNSRKREPKVHKKKLETNEKPLNNLKWLNKSVAEESVKKCQDFPDWFKNKAYKAKTTSETNISSDYENFPQREDDDKSSVSDASEECNCSHSKFPQNNKSGILKVKDSSTHSLVAKYIRSGMNQVASFIVESAIRFGEQHGVVVPDKDTPNLYDVTPPDGRFADKCRKIRFKVPSKSYSYEDAKKILWKAYNKNNGSTGGKRGQSPFLPEWESSHRTKSSSWDSTADSLEEILPILEKLKGGADIITSDLDLEKLGREAEEEENKEKEKERSRTRDRSRGRSSNRGKQRLREQLRTLKQRYRNLKAVTDKDSEENDNRSEERNRWKKCRRDSLELGRQRIRPATCSRKKDNVTQSQY